jgi:hypothetical protein
VVVIADNEAANAAAYIEGKKKSPIATLGIQKKKVEQEFRGQTQKNIWEVSAGIARFPRGALRKNLRPLVSSQIGATFACEVGVVCAM